MDCGICGLELNDGQVCICEACKRSLATGYPQSIFD